MSIAIKFCGMTRPSDVAAAAELGAAYVGVIFAGGPRHLSDEQAQVVLRDAPPSLKRVGVFGKQAPSEIQRIVQLLSLDVVQLHGDPTVDDVGRVRDSVAARLWPVLRLADGILPREAEALAAVGDGLVLDAKVAGALGGSGVALPWAELADAVGVLRGTEVVLAGGLSPTNVAGAIELLHPDTVDVSSGVERAPGIKDHARMRAFRDAVRSETLAGKGR